MSVDTYVVIDIGRVPNELRDSVVLDVGSELAGIDDLGATSRVTTIEYNKSALVPAARRTIHEILQ